jgi:glycosyltransferase involved in cell wall biosynthesis/2-polyprenyl-3-methyl-5-hydroxy-6-metoxy-1,4-benzoquinol methylase
MATLFVDCSYLCEHVFLNTGIQRVVRSFLEHAAHLEEKYGTKVVPVRISHGTFTLLSIDDLYEKGPGEHLSSGAVLSRKRRLVNYGLNVYRTSREFLNAICNSRRVSNFLFAPRDSFGLGFLVDKTVVRPLRIVAGGMRKNVTIEESDPFSVIGKDDILLLLDSTWYSDIWPSVRKFREHGNRVVAVIYDLIPITNPQFCDDYLAEVFKQWFIDSVPLIDGYVAISKTVRDDLIKFMSNRLEQKPDERKFDYFYLGGNFKHADSLEQNIRVELKNEFIKRPTYIIVSTIEPRKNHAYLLDAFDRLWKKGADINLFLIGRTGWKVEGFMERLHQHEQYNKRLFHWQDINDRELSYCYTQARALLFPSLAEGFGLPIIESLQNNLPVIASDIPIHKEIGSDTIGYCDISEPEDLVKIVEDIEQNGFGLVPAVHAGYKWLSWAESSEMLYEKILRIAGSEQTAPETAAEPIVAAPEKKAADEAGKMHKPSVPDKPALLNFSQHKEQLANLLLIEGDEHFVKEAYRLILGRVADPGGLQDCLFKLRAGVSRETVIVDMLFSPEASQQRQGSIQLTRKGKIAISLWKKGRNLRFWLGAIRHLAGSRRQLAISFDHLGELQKNMLTKMANQQEQLSNQQEQLSGLQNDLSCRLQQNAEKVRSEVVHFQLMEAQAQQRRLDQFIFDARHDLSLANDQELAVANLEAKSSHGIDQYYLALEESFRGRRVDIKKRYESYLDIVRPLLSGTEAIKAVDLGCGRGEWLQLLAECCADVRGIDSNAAMVAECHAHGLQAEQADLLDWLRRQTDQSLHLISAFHVIEHLSFPQLNLFMGEIYRTLTYDGIVLLETPNPENIFVAANMFYRDPTHQRPIPKELAEHLLDYHGFSNTKVHPLHPFPQEMHLPEDNELTRRFNHLIYGAQDYLITGEKHPAAQ